MNEWYHKVDNKTLVTNENNETIIRENVNNIEEVLTTENNIQDIKNKINKMSQELSGLQQGRRTFKGFRIMLNTMIPATILFTLTFNNFSIVDTLNYSLNQFFCALFFVGANIIVPAISKVIKLSISQNIKKLEYLKKELILENLKLKELKEKSIETLNTKTEPKKIIQSKYVNNLNINLKFIDKHIINKDFFKLFNSYKPSLNGYYSEEEIKFMEENLLENKNKKTKRIIKKI